MRFNKINEVVILHQVLGNDAQLHVVGGAVRDSILGIEPKDFDFATILHPQEVIRRLEAGNITVCPIGIRRGTVAAIINHEQFEITTFRCPGNETQFSDNIETDLSARDFTINAIAFSLNDNEIVDPFFGQEHLQNGIIITVGNARNRFDEDPHRIIRMFRFACKFGCVIDNETLLIAEEFSDRLKDIEIERIQAELVKIFSTLKGNKLVGCLRLLDSVKFFDNFIPELVACKEVGQNKFHFHDVFEHILCVVEGCRTFHGKLAALFHDIGKPQTKTINEDGAIHFYRHEEVGAEIAKTVLKRLRFSNDDIDAVVLLVGEHMRSLQGGPKSVRKTKQKLGKHFDAWKDLVKADKFGGRPDDAIKLFNELWDNFENTIAEVEAQEKITPTAKLAINGFDVMKILNIRPGVEVRNNIEKLTDHVFEFPEHNNVNDLTQILRAGL